MYFLLTAGYPSFLIMAGYILLLAFTCTLINLYRQKEFTQQRIFPLVKANAAIILVFLLIAFPALLSYADYFPYYQRSSGTSLMEAQQNPFDPFCLVSYIFPLSVTKFHAFITTDPTARSAYTGIFTWLFFISLLVKKNNRSAKIHPGHYPICLSLFFGRSFFCPAVLLSLSSADESFSSPSQHAAVYYNWHIVVGSG